MPKRPVEFRTLGAFFDAANRLAQRIDFSFGIELGIVGRIVIIPQLFGDPAVAHADNVAGRKMHQPGVIALSEKTEQIDRRIDVGRDCIAQIRIEIR